MSTVDARTTIMDAAEQWHEEDMDGAFIFFSTTNDNKKGADVAAYVEKYKLGVIVKMRPTRNPNSENMLTMWVWTVNKKNFLSYWHQSTRYKENYKSDN